MEGSNTKYTTLTEPMYLDSSDDVESFHLKLTAKIEAVVEAIQSLEDYEHRLGEKDDKKPMRKKMREELNKTENLIQETENLLRQFETMKIKKKDDVIKIIKRTKETFNKQKEKFSKVKKLIESKEKILLEPKASVESNQGNTLSGASTNAQSDMLIHVQDIDSYEKINEEREQAVQDIRKYADQIKGLAQDQADRLQEHSEVIDVIEHHIEDTEENTVKGNKELDKKLESTKALSKKNMICCAAMAITCGITIAIIAAEKLL
jgi:t-SNARE complex subunit (syntaxin)